ATTDTDKKELAINVEVVNAVVLVRSVASARFERMSTLDPGQGISPRERVVDQVCGSLIAKTKSHAAGEVQNRWAGRIIWRDTDPQFARSGQFLRGYCLQQVISLAAQPEIIQQGWRERSDVIERQKILLRPRFRSKSSRA